jgi:hypothetical protein
VGHCLGPYRGLVSTGGGGRGRAFTLAHPADRHGAAPLPELEAALAQLRQAGWPAPEDPAGSDDEELDGRDSIAERLVDEVRWVLECAEWVDKLAGGGFPQ